MEREKSSVSVPAIFLDRDGVIIENRPDYVRSWSEVEILEPALEALIWLAGLPYAVVIVTNQSAVGRNIISPFEADEINRLLVLEVEKAGGRIDAVYMCPHAPEEDCACRKPRPGLILQAAQDMGLDLSLSLMVGDAVTDIQAGQEAGVGQTAMVLTGRGRSQLSLSQSAGLAPFQIYPHLMAAVQTFAGHLLPQE
jgi:D-glycero-D-manno-heptose 1,7-bisphosphate phosphatase